MSKISAEPPLPRNAKAFFIMAKLGWLLPEVLLSGEWIVGAGKDELTRRSSCSAIKSIAHHSTKLSLAFWQ